MKQRCVRDRKNSKAAGPATQNVTVPTKTARLKIITATSELARSSVSHPEPEGSNASTMALDSSDASPMLQEILGDMLCERCQIHRVSNLKLETMTKQVLDGYGRLLEESLSQNLQGRNHCYTYRVTFQKVRKGSLNGWNFNAIYFYVECKPARGLFDGNSSNVVTKEHRFQAVYHGLFASAEGCGQTGTNARGTSLLLSGGARSIRMVMKDVLPRIIGCFVVEMGIMVGRDLQNISALYLLSCRRENSVDSNDVVRLKVPSKWVDSQCCSLDFSVPLEYFERILPEPFPAQQSIASLSFRLWYELFEVIKTPLPVNVNSRFSEISFRGFRVTGEGKIQAMNLSAEGSLVLLSSIMCVLGGVV